MKSYLCGLIFIHLFNFGKLSCKPWATLISFEVIAYARLEHQIKILDFKVNGRVIYQRCLFLISRGAYDYPLWLTQVIYCIWAGSNQSFPYKLKFVLKNSISFFELPVCRVCIWYTLQRCIRVCFGFGELYCMVVASAAVTCAVWLVLGVYKFIWQDTMVVNFVNNCEFQIPCQTKRYLYFRPL